MVPAEWSPHRAMWVGFPSHPELWEDNLAPAQAEAADLVRALAGPGGEHVRLLVSGEAAAKTAGALLDDVRNVEVVTGRFGDIWLRDTGPIFARTDGGLSAVGFRFNGWGGKYVLEGDDTVAAQIAEASGVALVAHDFVLEGGALDHDGTGQMLTTRQCLLNPNRNPGWKEGHAERALEAALGARKVFWLGEGLLNDHTDGHVDNLARFTGPGEVVCPVAWGGEDPNAEIFFETARMLAHMRGLDGERLKVARIGSPGPILNEDGEIVPASHMNFLIANRAVIMPVYEAESSGFALENLRSLFPDRAVIGLPSRAILSGGGSFHCITQQEPA